MSALSSMTNLVISPSVPYIAVDMAASILSVPAIEFGQFGDNALLIQTEICADVAINGYFYQDISVYCYVYINSNSGGWKTNGSMERARSRISDSKTKGREN